MPAPFQSQLLVLPLVMLLVGGVLSKPAPLRVQVADEEAAELGDDQAEDGDDATAEADSTGVRPVAILEHRQELQDDGTFNYAFSADNGLTQNEVRIIFAREKARRSQAQLCTAPAHNKLTCVSLPGVPPRRIENGLVLVRGPEGRDDPRQVQGRQVRFPRPGRLLNS